MFREVWCADTARYGAIDLRRLYCYDRSPFMAGVMTSDLLSRCCPFRPGVVLRQVPRVAEETRQPGKVRPALRVLCVCCVICAHVPKKPGGTL